MSNQNFRSNSHIVKNKHLKKKNKYKKQISSSEFIKDSHVVSLQPKKGTTLPFIKTNTKIPIKIWTNQIDSSALEQLTQISDIPYVYKKGIAVMPDVHYGKGVCIGSVIPSINALIPSAVGTDIGCGMLAVKTNLQANDLPDNLKPWRLAIEAQVPLGRSQHKQITDKNEWQRLSNGYIDLHKKNKFIYSKNVEFQLGTLGSGNHFIEICFDENEYVWIMLHSGSRGIGGVIGQYFIEKAKEWCIKQNLPTPHKELSYLTDDSPYFYDYVEAVSWAQEYAFTNRMVMLKKILMALQKISHRKIIFKENIVQCHHNYISREKHFNDLLWITRKGAISAKQHELGIIPGSMGNCSYIVEGKGEMGSYHSCSHGAGRIMSRSKAKQSISKEAFKQQTKGIECRKDSHVIDEAPQAYKNIQEVMKNQQDLVRVKHQLKQVICIKG